MKYWQLKRGHLEIGLVLLGLLPTVTGGCISGKDRPTDGSLQLDGVFIDTSPSISDKGGSDAPRSDVLPKLDAGGHLTRSGWALIPAGSFYMGSTTQELCRSSNETRHKVTLTHAIEMMVTEVTQQQMTDLLETNASLPKEKTCGKTCPVTAVSWHLAAYYCNALSTKEGKPNCYTCAGAPQSALTCGPAVSPIYGCKGYRLPTEAEWEYAYRAKTTTAYYNGDNTQSSDCINCKSASVGAFQIAWYCGNSANVLHPVQKKIPNPWLLYDMAGNANEWVDDWYHEDLGTPDVTNPWKAKPPVGKPERKVLRGGFWLVSPLHLRAAYRDNFEPSSTSTSYQYNGFRCVRTLSP
ncbi:MAG: formylglycine-generating enzyme family protein [Deltaproteobacteria bacterium]|nr:formylglycine-generating enzyme family protein [Deltaproteobacteria bacterium]